MSRESCKLLEHEEEEEETQDLVLPILAREYLTLRDVLITLATIQNIRRSQEMALFRLKEAREAKEVVVEGTTMWSVAVSQHKTAAKGSAAIFMTALQYQAFLAFLKYYRPLVVSCDQPDCIVFPSSVKGGQDCCKSMQISAVSKCLVRSLKKAGLDPGKLSSRNNRRSQITMMRELFPDDQTKRVLASLAAHSTTTQDRSYNYARTHRDQAWIFMKMKKVREDQLRKPQEQLLTTTTMRPLAIKEGIEEPEDTAAPEKDAEIGTPTTTSPLRMEEGIEEPEDTAAPEKDAEIGTPTTTSPLRMEEGIEEPEDTKAAPEKDAEIGTPTTTSPLRMEEGIEEPEDTAAPEKDAEIGTPTTTSPLRMEEGIEEPEDTAAPEKDAEIGTPTTTSRNRNADHHEPAAHGRRH